MEATEWMQQGHSTLTVEGVATLPCAFAAALEWFDEGANVLPVVRGGKVPPARLRWKHWGENRQRRDDVLKLLNEYRDHDLAVILGPSGLVDVEDDAPVGAEAIAALDLPPTATFASARGVHRLSRSRQRDCLRGAGWELRAGRHYSLIPESTNRRWISGRSLADAVDLPPAALERIKAIATRGRRAIEALEARAQTIGIEEGARNSSLYELLGRWRTKGASEDELRVSAIAYAKKSGIGQLEALREVAKLLNARRPLDPMARAHDLAVDRRLPSTATLALTGILNLRRELGIAGPTLAIPSRLLMVHARIGDHDTLRRGLELLERQGLIRLGETRAPGSGRRTTTVTLLPPVI